MDESVSEKMAPVFISIFEASFVLGPAFGYIIGGRLLNLYTEFYSKNLNLDVIPQVQDSNRIGAWWFGFLLIFGLSYFLAFIMSMFPAKMRKESEENTKDPNENVLATKLSYGRLQDIPKTLLGLGGPSLPPRPGSTLVGQSYCSSLPTRCQSLARRSLPLLT